MIEWPIHKQAGRQTDRQASGLTQRERDRQMEDRETEREID